LSIEQNKICEERKKRENLPSFVHWMNYIFMYRSKPN
jgi:hypothetical protein